MKKKLIKTLAMAVSSLLVFSSCIGTLKDKSIVRGSENSKKALKIIATSSAISEIADKLDLDLVAVPQTVVSKIPSRYENLPKIGSPMSPDLEKISEISPDYILSPLSLVDDLKPKYEAMKLNYAFLNLNSLKGMYKSIEDLEKLFNRKEEAKLLIDDFHSYMEEFTKKNMGLKKKKVLILMGLPGSYVVATEKSYVGDLVKEAGGINVYRDQDKAFINANTEDIKNKEADVILRCSHALPDQVMEMFDQEFKENDIWKHLKAVKQNEVYNLSYNLFGMSAKFNYKDALRDLEIILYPKGNDEKNLARKKSMEASRESMDSNGKVKYKKMRDKNE